MKGKFVIILLAIITTALCVTGAPTTEVKIANWPFAYKSAVSITIDTEGASEMEFKEITDILRDKGINATFFVVSGYFEGTAQPLHYMKDFEVANMGWMQDEWKDATLSLTYQYNAIKKSDYWLKKQGFYPRGFRAPFLNVNEDTFKVLVKLGYTYDSSASYGFYPYYIGQVLEIPLAFQYDPFWSDESAEYSPLPSYLAFQKSYNDDALFAFSTHPSHVSERIQHFSYLIQYMSSKNVWFASCGEVADWWQEKEKLDLEVKGNEIVVKNNGDKAIAGATVKIKPKRTIKGAASIWESEEAVYAVLPEIKAGSQVKITME